MSVWGQQTWLNCAAEEVETVLGQEAGDQIVDAVNLD